MPVYCTVCGYEAWLLHEMKCSTVFPQTQMKAIAAVVGGLLEEALKNHVGVWQLENMVGPLYL